MCGELTGQAPFKWLPANVIALKAKTRYSEQAMRKGHSFDLLSRGGVSEPVLIYSGCQHNVPIRIDDN